MVKAVSEKSTKTEVLEAYNQLLAKMKEQKAKKQAEQGKDRADRTATIAGQSDQPEFFADGGDDEVRRGGEDRDGRA